MPLFRASPEEINVALDAARPMINWAQSVPPADLAAELMVALGPNGPGQSGKTVSQDDLVTWLLRGYPDFSNNTIKAVSIRPHANELLLSPILEAMQLLDHAELACVAWWGDSAPHAEWRATRLGWATLASGKESVRQRIKDRTGL
ncbi:MAG: hypothetical protein JO191_07145 [Mycobacteriaceae bacterium]|nr:hypothetical protein [Mycobacteriaceae bacterium]MBV9515521.1 hypothetical protein [Mycobacteriaceae bacterium]